jgi:hypothetical protein
MDRNARNALHQRRTRIGRRSRATQAVEFFNVLTSPELLETTEALLPEHRERLYPPTVSLSMFMRQVLAADSSCQKPVNGWATQRAADGLKPCSVRTGGYCRARQRLPLEMLSTLTRETGRLLHEKARAQWLWRGRMVKLVDGTGAVLDMAVGPHSGKGIDPRELSFKHTVQLWTEWGARGLSATKDEGLLFTLNAQYKVGNRSGRMEPRMRKRRPRPYPWLKVPRANARQKIKKHVHDWEPK